MDKPRCSTCIHAYKVVDGPGLVCELEPRREVAGSDGQWRVANYSQPPMRGIDGCSHHQDFPAYQERFRGKQAEIKRREHESIMAEIREKSGR